MHHITKELRRLVIVKDRNSQLLHRQIQPEEVLDGKILGLQVLPYLEQDRINNILIVKIEVFCSFAIK